MENVNAVVNGERVNQIHHYQHYLIPEGRIIYDPVVQRTGTLSICSRGRVVLSFSLSGSRVFRHFALHYNSLKITQDRGTISSSDQEFIYFLQNAFRCIWEDQNLSFSQKAFYLNSLAPLIEKFSLKNGLRMLFLKQNLGLYPAMITIIM
ncbi:MAG: hypothetical protein HWD61_12760 [Parachlamydiaceae bacterium]|nr:MAG: hypothetical protein HWD61_12760 [Parachlamydiaceae bacterium]